MADARKLIKTVRCWWCGGTHPGGHIYLRGQCPYTNDPGPDSWYEPPAGMTEAPAIDYVEWKRRYASRLMHHGWNERAAFKEAEYVWAGMEDVDTIPTPEDAADEATADSRKEDAPHGVTAVHPMRDGYAGSTLSSGPEGPHKLAVFYDTPEQADAAQDWLAAGVDLPDGGQRG